MPTVGKRQGTTAMEKILMEYKVLTYSMFDTTSTLERYLEEMYKDGFELITTNEKFLFFKRRKKPSGSK
jgi:hypothetical protein